MYTITFFQIHVRKNLNSKADNMLTSLNIEKLKFIICLNKIHKSHHEHEHIFVHHQEASEGIHREAKKLFYLFLLCC